jgi:hypothetical protein
MVTPGVDCNIALSHPSIRDGEPYGFLLDDSKEDGPAVSVQREAVRQDDGSYLDNQKYFFTILLADKLPNPDGSTHTEDAAAMYASLMQYLGQHSDLALLTPSGTFSGLYASGHYATEVHYPDVSLVTVQMGSSGTSFDPVDVTRFVLSEWVDGTVYAGEMTWANTYWR